MSRRTLIGIDAFVNLVTVYLVPVGAAGLLYGDLALPLRGSLVLWLLVVLLVGLSALELARSRRG